MSLTPLKAIRKHCLECSGGSWNEVKLCVIPTCPLYRYRFGHNPKRKGIGNPQGNIANLRLRKKH